MEKSIKTGTFLKTGIYIVILVGILVYLYGLYQAGTNLKVEDVEMSTVEIVPPTSLRLKVNAEFNNPTNYEINVKNLLYKVYVEDKYVGEGYKRDLLIGTGLTKSLFEFEFNAKDVVESIRMKSKVNVTVKGQVDVPLKVFGLFTYKTVSVPYTYTKTVNVSVSEAVDNTLNKTKLNETKEEIKQVLPTQMPTVIPTSVPTLPSLPTPTATPTLPLPTPTLPQFP